MIVSLGAAAFVIIPLQVDSESTFYSINALSQTLQGVAAGVGFLGAGMILQQSHQKLSKAEVKGLTSAATIWLTAGLGAAAGCGLWRMSLIGTLMTLVVLSGVKRLKKSSLIRLDDYKVTKIKATDTASTQDKQQQ